MNATNGEHFPPPSPELLAAYVDGEFEGNEALLSLKRSIEDWLEQHPEAAADILAWRRLKRQCQRTAADDPGEEKWAALWARVEQTAAGEAAPRRVGVWWRAAGAAVIFLACSAAAWFTWQHLAGGTGPVVVATAPHNTKPVQVDDGQGETVEPFPVASSDEVIVLHVEGDDAQTLAVGRMPIDGPLLLAQQGDILLNSVEPSPGDDKIPDVNLDQGPPMIWARVDRERNEPK